MQKRWMSSTDRAREAIMAAYSEHDRLGLDLSQPVDIFDIIERERIWLFFVPLEDLYGTYEREEGTPGIFVNVRHPLYLQRYTAAHEYGHHVLGRSFGVDDAETIEPTAIRSELAGRVGLSRGRRKSELYLTPEQRASERAAQIFAAHFLMPPELVNAVLRRRGLPLRPTQLSPIEAYQVYLDLGTSYAATVNHLVQLRTITRQQASELHRVQPKQIKADIGREIRPVDPHADVWLVDEPGRDARLRPRVHDELCIRLPENPSTGYVWKAEASGLLDLHAHEATEEPENPVAIVLLRDDFEPRFGVWERFGGGGTRQLVFRVEQLGRQSLQLSRQRPWQASSDPIETLVIDLDVLPQRETSGSEHGGVRKRMEMPLTA